MTKLERVSYMYKIWLLCNHINVQDSRGQQEGPTVSLFFPVSGHTTDFQVDVHENGWQPHQKPTKSFLMYLDMSTTGNDEEIKKCYSYLKSLLQKED